MIKARIFGNKKSGAKIELLFLKPVGEYFLVQIKGKVKENDELLFSNDLKAIVRALNSDGSRIVEFFLKDEKLKLNRVFEILEEIGCIPLPPYIKREAIASDKDSYQSVFAKKLGSVAAPTASLHFSDELFRKVTSKYKYAFVTLHIGSGTFLPVSSENILDHKMHSEYYELSKEAIELIESDTKILTIGSTSTRCTEEYVRSKKSFGECSLFLHPQNRPIRTNAMLTNFHLPKSTLFILVASFVGLKKAHEIYEIAIKKKYRFFSYGDAMLIL